MVLVCKFIPNNGRSFATYNALNVYCRELAPGTVSLTGDRAQGDDSKHCAYSNYRLKCSGLITGKCFS